MDTTHFSTPSGLADREIRIGTRESPLALWQAEQVAAYLRGEGIPHRLVPIHSEGDLTLDVPLYAMGITGIFTRALDTALIRKEVDLAVHSFKDVPTQLPRGLSLFAVLPREEPWDTVVLKSNNPLPEKATIATGSLRRQAQWLRRYPSHRVVDLRGNVQTRLARLDDQPWQGALFASAGLRRLNIHPPFLTILDWMIPAPAQGAVAVIGRTEDLEIYRPVYSGLNHDPTRRCVLFERAFLQELEGGCTAPIGAYAWLDGDQLQFRAGLYSTDGLQAVELERSIPSADTEQEVARGWAREVLAQGGTAIMQTLRA